MPKIYDQKLARLVLGSERENGDLIPDLHKLACQLAVELRRSVSTDEARATAAKQGLAFDAEGWVQ